MEVNMDFEHILGKIKPMHAVNNGPVPPWEVLLQWKNLEDYKAAGIPYARNHDAAFCLSYGGEHTVDINAVFPNFDADVNDPASYDFACTDFYTKLIMDAVTEVFYRLGNKIYHRVKKYDSVPPKDFHKWAQICEHIIAHYNEGWANGFHHNIQYWEIWNEPDTGDECWYGPMEDFFQLFAITAKHLKERFPHIKIGGPAFGTGGVEELMDSFLQYMKERDVPLDFFSWHIYHHNTEAFKNKIFDVRRALDQAGYTETESILDEWAFVIDWFDGFRESINTILGLKGAAFAAAVMATGQNSPLDMLMYYDARHGSPLNCLFDFYTLDRLKGYYPFKMYSTLYQLGQHAHTLCDASDIYAVAATDGKKRALMLTYFTNDQNAAVKRISLNFSDQQNDTYSVRLLDENNDDAQGQPLTVKNGKAELQLAPNTVVLLENSHKL